METHSFWTEPKTELNPPSVSEMVTHFEDVPLATFFREDHDALFHAKTSVPINCSQTPQIVRQLARIHRTEGDLDRFTRWIQDMQDHRLSRDAGNRQAVVIHGQGLNYVYDLEIEW